MEQVAVITGANSGVGLAVAKRLLSEVAPGLQFRLCLACRNQAKAKAVKGDLLKEYPHANIDLLTLDTSDPQSCVDAAKGIIERYPHGIRWLYCNAGIMPIKPNWFAALTIRKSVWEKVLSTGSGISTYQDWVLPGTTNSVDGGLQAVFMTNTLGHYLMVRELEDYLVDQTQPCHIIWTSSNAASVVEVDPNDIQSKERKFSYPNSKRVMDLISLDINRRLNIHGIYSDTACPGMVITQMTLSILPGFLWKLMLPIIFLIRVFITHFLTYNVFDGAESIMWLSKQNPSSVDHSLKYFSRKPPFGGVYILKEKIPYTEVLLNNTMTSVNFLAKQYFKRNM